MCQSTNLLRDDKHWFEGRLHGIHRQWNFKGCLHRGYPKYYVYNQQVNKRQYISATKKDSTLPKFREKDQSPERNFPGGIVKILCRLGECVAEFF